MGWRKQCAKEAEVEVQLEENCETPGRRVTVENLTLRLPLNYGGMIVKNVGDWWMPIYGPNQRPKQAETINCRQQNVIAFYQFFTNDYTTSELVLKSANKYEIILFKLDVGGQMKNILLVIGKQSGNISNRVLCGDGNEIYIPRSVIHFALL